MKLKTWFKTVRKKMNKDRIALYKVSLRNRFISKKQFISNYITNELSNYPDYIVYSIKNQFNYFCPDIFSTSNIQRLLIFNKQLDVIKYIIMDCINKIKKKVIDFNYNRQSIDLNHVKFVEITNVLGLDVIGFISYYSERGNDEYDTKIFGIFFNDHGDEIEIDRLDKTYLVTPIENDNTYKRFINLYGKSSIMQKSTLDIQMQTFKTLNDLWCKQLTYLKQLENDY